MSSVEKFPSIEDMVQRASTVFQQEFHREPNIVTYAPGRVNLIGEHTDYNEGFVLPLALPLGTIIVGSVIKGETSTVITTSKSADKPHKILIEMPNSNALIRRLAPQNHPQWANYIRGIISNYLGQLPPTFEAVIFSTVPMGAGLASSAALEVAFYTFLDALTPPNQNTLIEKALACQKVEHEFLLVPCGIMDQYIAFMGQDRHALLIDCRNLTSTAIPFGGHRTDQKMLILIADSNVKHQLADGEYAKRKAQCQQAALILKKLSLRDATLNDIDYLESLNADPIIVKRARHVVTEIERTLLASKALENNDFKMVGELMTKSHLSLRDDYEVSCPELDQLVEIALEVNGVRGSRMTGGGFGGCTVTLLEENCLDDLIQQIQRKFKFGTVTYYLCKSPQGGARILCQK